MQKNNMLGKTDIKFVSTITILCLFIFLLYPKTSIYAAEKVMLAKRSVFESIFGGNEYNPSDSHYHEGNEEDTDSYLPPEETSRADESIEEALKKVKPLPNNTDISKVKPNVDTKSDSSIQSNAGSDIEKSSPENEDIPSEIKAISTRKTIILPKADIRIVNRNSGKTDIIEINNDESKQYNALQIKLSKCWREDYRDIVNKDSALIEVSTINTKQTEQDAKKSNVLSTGKYWIFSHYPEINTYVSKDYHIFLLSCKD